VARTTVKLLTTLGGRLVKDNGELEADDMAQVLEQLAARHGKDFREEIYDGEGIKNYYIVLHNGEVIDRERPGTVALSDGDTVHIFPPVSGG
jgi:MoaD family protein